jgi:hypothetical protein
MTKSISYPNNSAETGYIPYDTVDLFVAGLIHNGLVSNTEFEIGSYSDEITGKASFRLLKGSDNVNF